MMRSLYKVKTLLKSKSGASLMFVLGIMMMLLAVGASVMTAATANVGSNIRQNHYNNAVLLSDSIHRNIMHSLNMDESDADFDTSLRNKLSTALYEANKPVANDGDTNLPLDGFEMSVGVDGVDMSALERIDVRIPFQDIRFAGPVGYVPETGTNRVPFTASINVRIIVTVEVSIHPTGMARVDDRTITTRAVYELSNAFMSDEGDILYTEEDSSITGELEFESFGNWKMVSYEIIESHASSN